MRKLLLSGFVAVFLFVFCFNCPAYARATTTVPARTQLTENALTKTQNTLKENTNIDLSKPKNTLKENANIVEDLEKNKTTLSKAELDKYKVINPEKRTFSTGKKTTFIDGIAPENTNVEIKILGTIESNNDTFDLVNLPEETDYVELSKETIKVGKLGVFDKKLTLVEGINKIVVSFNTPGVPDVEMFVLVKLTDEDYTDINTIIKKSDISVTNLLLFFTKMKN